MRDRSETSMDFGISGNSNSSFSDKAGGTCKPGGFSGTNQFTTEMAWCPSCFMFFPSGNHGELCACGSGVSCWVNQDVFIRSHPNSDMFTYKYSRDRKMFLALALKRIQREFGKTLFELSGTHLCPFCFIFFPCENFVHVGVGSAVDVLCAK